MVSLPELRRISIHHVFSLIVVARLLSLKYNVNAEKSINQRGQMMTARDDIARGSRISFFYNNFNRPAGGVY